MFAMKMMTLFAVVLASVAAFSPASTLLGSNLKVSQARRSTSSRISMALKPPQQPSNGKLLAAVTDWSFSADQSSRFALNLPEQLQTASRALLPLAIASLVVTMPAAAAAASGVGLVAALLRWVKSLPSQSLFAATFVVTVACTGAIGGLLLSNGFSAISLMA
jgi:hypothetical protein